MSHRPPARVAAASVRSRLPERLPLDRAAGPPSWLLRPAHYQLRNFATEHRLSEANIEEKAIEAPSAPVIGLSSREQEVITLASKGASNKEIAHMLGVAHATVRVLVSRAAAKWRVKTRAELILAFQRGLEHVEQR
jgi:DNA-binding NarL/FixJ family response regulator